MTRVKSIFLDTLELERQLSHMKLFQEFINILPKDITKEKLLEENETLIQMDFTDLINKYY